MKNNLSFLPTKYPHAKQISKVNPTNHPPLYVLTAHLHIDITANIA